MITLRDRVIAFFLGAPDEEITGRWATLRWGLHRNSVDTALQVMVKDGLLKRSVGKSDSKFGGEAWVYTPTQALLDLGKGTP